MAATAEASGVQAGVTDALLCEGLQLVTSQRRTRRHRSSRRSPYCSAPVSRRCHARVTDASKAALEGLRGLVASTSSSLNYSGGVHASSTHAGLAHAPRAKRRRAAPEQAGGAGAAGPTTGRSGILSSAARAAAARSHRTAGATIGAPTSATASGSDISQGGCSASVQPCGRIFGDAPACVHSAAAVFRGRCIRGL